jgi:1,4-dihydroxy-2-naphthoyl-CoA hydrolase
MVAGVLDLADVMNSHPEGWVREMGLHVTTATAEEVRCEWEVGPQHLQAYGIVHGGVHCGVIETLASAGAAAFAIPRGQAVVGLENTTSFVRAVRAGTRLHAVAVPLTRGRKSQLWEGRILDADDRLVAIGRVRLLCLPADEALAGEAPARP